MIKVISVMLSLIIALSPSVNANNAESWYLKRGAEGTAPTVSPTAEYIRSQNGFFIDDNAYAAGEKVIYLTFDAGYENGNIERILNVMKEKGVTGAFFILSNLINKNPELVKRMVDEGHTVCNHTKNHKDMTTLTDLEMKNNLISLENEFKALTGVEMSKFFRFPEGRYNKEKVALCNSLGYRCVFWSAAYADWDNNKQPNADWAFEKLILQTHPGAIYLLHPTSKTNADILERLIDKWTEMGYKIGCISDIK